MKFGMVLESHVLCVAGPDFRGKIFLLPKLWKWVQNLLINFYWICSIMKIYIICCALHKSHIWKIFLSWDMGQIVFSQSDCRIFQLTISPEQINEIAWFLHVDTNSHKLKVDQKFLGWTWSEMGVTSLVHRTLKLTISQEWVDGMN